MDTATDPTGEKPSFDLAARVVSALSLVGSFATLLIFMTSPDRGIQFGTHLMLILILLAQLAVFVLFIFIGVIIAAFRGGLTLTGLTALLIVAATVAFVCQFFAVENVKVDGSSVP